MVWKESVANCKHCKAITSLLFSGVGVWSRSGFKGLFSTLKRINIQHGPCCQSSKTSATFKTTGNSELGNLRLSQFWVSSCFEHGRSYAGLTACPMYSTFSGTWCCMWMFINLSLVKSPLPPELDHTPLPLNSRIVIALQRLQLTTDSFQTTPCWICDFQLVVWCLCPKANEHRYVLSVINLHMTRIEKDFPGDCQRDSWWWLLI